MDFNIQVYIFHMAMSGQSKIWRIGQS